MNDHNLNLLPVSFLKRSLLRVRFKQWGTVICIIWVGLISYYLFLRAEVQQEIAKVEQLRAEVGPIRVQQAETSHANQEIAKLQKRQQLGIGLEQKNIPLQALGKVSRAAASRAGNLYLTRFQLESQGVKGKRLTHTVSAEEEETEKTAEMSLLLEGLALDDLTITEFIDDMQGTGLFYSVELTSITEEKVDDLQLRTFVIECQL